MPLGTAYLHQPSDIKIEVGYYRYEPKTSFNFERRRDPIFGLKTKTLLQLL